MGTCSVCNFVILGFIAVTYGFSYTGERSIRSSVLDSFAYDRMARPNETTTAHVGFNILSVNDVDILQQELICTGWFTVLWHDERLMWQPSVYDDTDYIHALETEIWKPEVLVSNAKEDVGLISDDHLIYRIKYTGYVQWEPLMKFTVHCSIDVTYFPFDTQTCFVKLMSWGLPTTEFIFAKLFDGVNFGDYEENGSWEVIKNSSEVTYVVENNSGTTEYFSQLAIGFTFRRIPGLYRYNTLVPIICSSFLMSLTILIPIVSGERLTSAFLVMVINGILMTSFMMQIPDIATTTSILGVYLSFGYSIDVAFIFLSVILTRVHNLPSRDPVGKIHGFIIFVLKIITCYCDPPIVVEEEEPELSLMTIPTDDLKKIERSDIPRRRNAVGPELENGFTEHITLKMPALPPITSRPGTSKGERVDISSKQLDSKSSDDYKEEVKRPKKIKEPELTWEVVALVYDRVLFVVCIVVKILYNMSLIGDMLGNPVDLDV